MNKQVISSIALAVTAVLAVSSSWAQNVAIVNGKPVPTSRVDALTQQVAAQGKPVTPEMTKQIKEEVINREVFVQEAQKRGIEGSDDYKTQMEMARQAIMIRALFSDYQKKNPVTDAEIQAEYDKFANANGGKEYRASHILVEKEDDAKKLIADIKKGGKFADIAKKSSKDPGSGAKGGDLDWANAGSYVKEFSEAMTKLEKGKMTDAPVKSQFGFHIIRLDDTRQAQLPPVDQVKPQIAQQLVQQKLANFQKEMLEKAKIE
jgi:peptidyl-prolyl cis-trans isomerase C